MPIFSLDHGRLHPAVSSLSHDPEIAAHALMAIRDQVTELLHQPFFPVSWLTETARLGQVERHTSLVALEPSGQTVTIDVVPLLDSTTLMSCLARAGRHSDMNRGRLASLYPRGTAAFRRDWQEFLDSCPAMSQPGPRLIILALEVDTEMRGALDSLLGTGVQLFRITLHESRDGILVSLDEVRPHEASFRSIAQAARHEEISGAPSAITAEEVDDWDEGETEPAVSEEVEAAENVEEAEADEPAEEPNGEDEASEVEDALAPETETAEAGEQLPPELAKPEYFSTAGNLGWGPKNAERLESLSAGVLSSHVAPDSQTPTSDIDSSTHEHDEPSSEIGQIVADHGELEVTFKSLRRRVNATGRLVRDGLVVDGVTYPGPDEAAEALTGRPADGWRVWRLKDGRRLSDVR